MTIPRKPESEKLVRRDVWALPRTWQSIDEEAKARNISRQYIIRERLEKAVNGEVKRGGK